MDWTKIQTTLIINRFSDYEILSIVKFQLVWAVNEEQPDKKTCLRYMTPKQYETAMTYLDSISATVSGDVSRVERKRVTEKKRYYKNKDITKILPTDCQQTGDSLPNQIRIDNTKEKESKEKDEGYNDFDNTDTPLLSASASNQEDLFETDCSTYADGITSKRKSSRSSDALTQDKVIDWDSLFLYWEQNKNGKKYKNAESRNRMLAKLKELTFGNFNYAKLVILDAIDHQWQGFCGADGLYYKGEIPSARINRPQDVDEHRQLDGTVVWYDFRENKVLDIPFIANQEPDWSKWDDKKRAMR